MKSSRSSRVAYLLIVSFSALLPTLNAHADVFGRIHVVVKNVDDEKPIAGAVVIVHDLGGAKPDLTLTTDNSGSVITPPLENRSWQVTASAPHFEKSSTQVRVLSDSVGDVELSLEPSATTIRVTSDLSITQPNNTSNFSSRNRAFSEAFPISVQKPQQLTGLLMSNPGFVSDSANQVHPRGEHSATSIYIQGFQLGGAAQGRFGPILDPRTLENIDIMTGAFAPEYAGDSAILNSTIRSGTKQPFAYAEIGGGNYHTGSGNFSVGGQAGRDISAPDSDGNTAKIFSFFLNGSAQSTDNAMEAPQPKNQTAHNHGTSQSLLGRFDLNPTKDDTISLILNGSPAKTQVANRSGLPEQYAPYGQGYGYGGSLSEAQAQQQGIVSQNVAGQDIYQKDDNRFAVLQWRHQYDEDISTLFSFGADQSKLATLNNNPDVDLNNLPENNSIEFNPVVRRNAEHLQASGSVTMLADDHTFKFGAQYIDETSHDSYELTPASQLAADALYATDPRLAPSGTPQFDANGDPVLDSQGNQLYLLTPGATTPTLKVKSTGYSAAAYAQDTWRILSNLTANYGVRFDAYRQHQNLGQPDVDETQFSPRVNLSYAFYPTWVARASYNRLFIAPPQSQGAIIGAPIQPEKVNQYEASLEKQLTARQVAKVAYYYKDITNQVDTSLLIPSTQMGLYTSVNLDKDAVHGFELSYDLLPDHNYGTSAFVAYTHSSAKPSGFDSTGEEAPKYNDHDQRNTLSSGISHTFDNEITIGTTGYYGSGVTSSALTEGGKRKANSRFDFSASTGPKALFGCAGLKFAVSNLLDDRTRINFNSGYSGTRFEQGRTIMLSVFASF